MTDPIPPLSPSLLMQHAPGLRALVRRLVLDDSRVDDVLQETWLVALESPPRSQAALGSWLRTVASRLAYKTTRNDHHRSHHESRAAQDEPSPSASDIVEREMARRRVVDAVLELREPYQATILHRFLENLSAQEIAARLDLPVETVRTRVKRGIEQLRRILDERHDGDYRRWHQSLILLTTLPVGTITQVVAATTLFGLSLKALWLSVAALLMFGLLGFAAVSLWPPVAGPASSFTVQFTADELAPSDVPELLELNADGSNAIVPASEREAVVLPASNSPHLILEGRIIDAAARPVAGADVSLFLWPGRGSWRSSRGRMRPGPRGQFRVERSVRTGADGSYRFEGPAFDDTSLLISVAHAEYAPTVRKNQWRLDEGVLHLPDTLVAAGQEAFGRVLDAQGKPLAGVQVNCRPMDAAAFVPSIETDPFGGFRFRHLPRGRFLVEAQAADGMRVTQSFEATAAVIATNCGDLVIQNAIQVTGRVLDLQNSPIANARVKAVPTGSSESFGKRGRRQHKGAQGRTDEDGYFSLSLTKPGPHVFESEHLRFVTTRERAQISESGNRSGLVLTMHARFAITGRVFARESDEPIPRYKLQVQAANKRGRPSRGFRRSVDEDKISILEDGSFRIEDLEPGSYRVIVTAPSFAKTSLGPFDWQAAAQVQLHADRGASIRGRVASASDHASMPGALVKLHRTGDNARSLAQTKTDTDGQFRFRAQQAGQYEIEVQVPDHPPSLEAFELRHEAMDIGTVAVRHGATVHGRVNGLEPGTRAIVAFRHSDGARRETSMDPRSGRYEIQGLEAGSWCVDILPRDARGEYSQRYGLLTDDRSDLVIQGSSKRRFDPSIHVYGSLRGQVRLDDRLGTGLEARLRRSQPGKDSWMRALSLTAATDALGSYHFDAIPAGSYILEIHRKGERFGPRLSTHAIEIHSSRALRIDPDIHTWPIRIEIRGAADGTQLKLTTPADAETQRTRRRFANTRYWTVRQHRIAGRLPTGIWQYELVGPGTPTRKGTLEVSQALDLIWDPRTEPTPKNR